MCGIFISNMKIVLDRSSALQLPIYEGPLSDAPPQKSLRNDTHAPNPVETQPLHGLGRLLNIQLSSATHVSLR